MDLLNSKITVSIISKETQRYLEALAELNEAHGLIAEYSRDDGAWEINKTAHHETASLFDAVDNTVPKIVYQNLDSKREFDFNKYSLYRHIDENIVIELHEVPIHVKVFPSPAIHAINPVLGNLVYTTLEELKEQTPFVLEFPGDRISLIRAPNSSTEYHVLGDPLSEVPLPDFLEEVSSETVLRNGALVIERIVRFK